MRFYKNPYFLLSVAGGVILWASWPPSPLSLLIFIAWLPLLYISNRVSNWKKLLGYAYIHMLLWNLLTTWWVAKASMEGGTGAITANSLLMCIPWLLYYFTKQYASKTVSILSLVVYWLTFEYIHQNWELSWPWLTLGNMFASHPNWVQWYEYTGTSGGSLWIMLSNVLAFHTLQTYRRQGRSLSYYKLAATWIVLLFIPILFSFFIKNNSTLLRNKYNVVVVQPNIEPYLKFEAGMKETQLRKLITLSEQEIDAQTALVVWPETAIPFQTDEAGLKNNFALYPLWKFLNDNPHINLLTGLEGFKQFETKVSRFAKPTPDGRSYYETYNSAVLLDSSRFQIYHKSKLVPGVEVLPKFLSFMASAFEKFGGTGGGYAPDSVAKVFHTYNKSFNITPAICYESIYGEYLADFNRKGANLICIITNDGWWDNTPGYKQHMAYGQLRAIESRKWIARSANTGISCFIDPFGSVIQQLGWKKEGTLKQKVAAFATETFYTRYGDVISKISIIPTVVLLVLSLALKFYKHKTKIA